MSATLHSLDVLLFPELVDGGYAALAQGAAPHRSSDPYLAGFQSASNSYSFTCVAGSVAFEHSKGRRTNTSFVFRDGKTVARYDKVHLFEPTGDHLYFVRGKNASSFHLGNHKVRAGVIICYDIRFPELVRGLALQGIQVLFVPARWPLKRDDAWRTLLKARAIENQIFVVGCNARGKEGGYSYAFDPLGKLVFSNRRRPHSSLSTFVLDLNVISIAKQAHDNLREAVLLRGRTR